MSWAPFFHPSSDYLIFATNKHGFENFELYMVDAAGEQEPVRVSYRKGFDGLPVFPPGGKTLVWTSNGGGSQSQLYEAKWNDAAARKLLKLGPAGAKKSASKNESPASIRPATAKQPLNPWQLARRGYRLQISVDISIICVVRNSAGD